MDFRQIEAFMYVVRYKSFSKAADAVFLTQPTISAHISSLENEIGTKLIDRSGKEILPTKAGKLFYDYAVNLINIRDNAVFHLSEFTNKIEGKVEIAASTVPGQYLMPELMAAFIKLYPNISFSILQLDSGQVIDQVLEKNFELGIVGTKIENSKLKYDFLTEDKLVLAAPHNKRFTSIQEDTIPFSLVENENFIYRESGSGTRQEFERILSKHGINPKAVKMSVQLNSIDAIKQSVSIGLGVSIMSLMSIEDYVRFGLVKVFNLDGFDLKRAFYVVTHKNRPLSPVNAAFLKYLLEYYK